MRPALGSGQALGAEWPNASPRRREWRQAASRGRIRSELEWCQDRRWQRLSPTSRQRPRRQSGSSACSWENRNPCAASQACRRASLLLFREYRHVAYAGPGFDRPRKERALAETRFGTDLVGRNTLVLQGQGGIQDRDVIVGHLG